MNFRESKSTNQNQLELNLLFSPILEKKDHFYIKIKKGQL